jgi:hypothetical protein
MGAGKGGGRGGGSKSVKRAWRTLFFMILMLGSLLVSSIPLLVTVADISVPWIVLSTFTCCKSCFSSRVDWSSYSFRSSLVDIPLISFVRSLAAISVERERRLGFPLLLISSVVFALVHIVVACKSGCPARRKLTFFLTDAESVAICKIGGNTYPRNLALFRKLDLDCRSILGGKYDSDKDVPARMIADKQSLFMDL